MATASFDTERRAADDLDAAAVAVEEAMRLLGAHHRDDVWRGRLADRFGEALADQHRRGRLASEELLAQARVLRARSALRALGPEPLP